MNLEEVLKRLGCTHEGGNWTGLPRLKTQVCDLPDKIAEHEEDVEWLLIGEITLALRGVGKKHIEFGQFADGTFYLDSEDVVGSFIAPDLFDCYLQAAYELLPEVE